MGGTYHMHARGIMHPSRRAGNVIPKTKCAPFCSPHGKRLTRGEASRGRETLIVTCLYRENKLAHFSKAELAATV